MLRPRGFRSAHSTQCAPPHGLAHPRVPSELGGSGSRAENSVRGGAGTQHSEPRSGSRASSAAVAPGLKRSPWKRSRVPRGARPSSPPDARAAAPARSRNRGESCQRCEVAGWGKLRSVHIPHTRCKPSFPGLDCISRLEYYVQRWNPAPTLLFWFSSSGPNHLPRPRQIPWLCLGSIFPKTSHYKLGTTPTPEEGLSQSFRLMRERRKSA